MSNGIHTVSENLHLIPATHLVSRNQQAIAFYNGTRITSAESDARHWEQNANTLRLDEATVLDVPSPFNDRAVYRATLGHKCNHCRAQENAVFARWVARLGQDGIGLVVGLVSPAGSS